MAISVPIPAAQGGTRAAAIDRDSAVPWYLWCAVVAVTISNIGGPWDIAWHRSIGRDTFWSPPHLAIYLGGVLAGLTCASLILTTTFGRAGARGTSVSVWGFRGPLGAFLASWGGVAMISSAPFDNWWHGAYGLDVKILSPPHVVLIAGILSIQLGILTLILGEMNRAEGPARRRLQWLFLYVGGMILSMLYTSTLEWVQRDQMHSAVFYRAVCLALVAALVAVARTAETRWAATTEALVYSVFMLLLLWILPLGHATPKLGPVVRPVTTLIPSGFPLLIVAPALVLDTFWSRVKGLSPWVLAIATGALFLASFAAVQWPFADFLNSPAAYNAVIGSGYLDYRTGPQSYLARNAYRPFESGPGQFWAGMGVALAAAILMARLGLAWGDWMRKLRR